jgi:hypothetical protein
MNRSVPEIKAEELVGALAFSLLLGWFLWRFWPYLC